MTVLCFNVPIIAPEKFGDFNKYFVDFRKLFCLRFINFYSFYIGSIDIICYLFLIYLFLMPLNKVQVNFLLKDYTIHVELYSHLVVLLCWSHQFIILEF